MQLCARESLVADFDVPVKEIYRKNRQSDTSSFDPEYWFGKEGVRFGSGKRSALIYHTPEVSSIADRYQEASLLMINLEYSPDHPFFNIPFQKDGGGRWTDLSEAAYKAGDTRKNSFSINFGDFPAAVPRIMLVPEDIWQAMFSLNMQTAVISELTGPLISDQRILKVLPMLQEVLPGIKFRLPKVFSSLILMSL